MAKIPVFPAPNKTLLAPKGLPSVFAKGKVTGKVGIDPRVPFKKKWRF